MNKKTITLYINTSDSQITVITIMRGNKRQEYVASTQTSTKSQHVLPLIEAALMEQALTLKDITAIEVNQGPGSFTGTRVGVSVANTLAWALHVPVNGKKIELPKYAESKFD